MKFMFWGCFTSVLFLISDIMMFFFIPKHIRSHGKTLNLMKWLGILLCCLFMSFRIGVFGFGFDLLSKGIVWSLLTLLFFLIQIFLWIRYFKSGRNDVKLYSFFIIPFPMIIIPFLFYFLTGIFCRNLLITLSSIVYGIGNVICGVKSLKQLKRIEREENDNIEEDKSLSEKKEEADNINDITYFNLPNESEDKQYEYKDGNGKEKEIHEDKFDTDEGNEINMSDDSDGYLRNKNNDN